MRKTAWGSTFISFGLLAAACASAPPTTPTPTAAPTPIPTPTAPATSRATPAQAPTPTASPTQAATPRATPHPSFASQPGAVRSDGCNNAVPAPGDQTIEVTIHGELRSALLHVPPYLSSSNPEPLVIVLHGTAMDGEQMVAITGFSNRADRTGFFVVYPNAIGDWQSWNALESPDAADDVAFELGLVDQLAADYCVDMRRIYVSGFSIGGAMALLAACRDDRIAAVAAVSAANAVDTGCVPEDRQVPAAIFHGLLDPIVPWRGGLNPIPELADLAPYRPVLEWATEWAQNNGCDPEPVEGEQIGDWVVPFDWQGCQAPVTFYRVGDGGHSWPGGAGHTVFGAINQDINATDVSISFFLENAQPQPGTLYENSNLGYRVRVPSGWPQPWVGSYGYHQRVEGSVTFPVGEPIVLDIWATQMVLTGGKMSDGVPTVDGILTGATAEEVAASLIERVPGYSVTPSGITVDGEPVVMLTGSRLPMAAVFTHLDRAFLLFVYHELPGVSFDREQLTTFLSRLEFTG